MSMMRFALQMAGHPKAMQEFSLILQAIQPVMTDPQETRDTKRGTLSMAVDLLSESTFKLKPVAEQIMGIINMKEEVCREYLDSESQTDGILEWLPRMKEYRKMLLEEVKGSRKSFGLNV